MTKTQNKKGCEISLISALLRLIKRNVPALLIWSHKGTVKQVGSQCLSEWFNGLDDATLNNLRTKMVEDVINISEKQEDLLVDCDDVPDKVKASSVYKNIIQSPGRDPSGVDLLPYPLHLMSKKDMMTYLSKMIRDEAGVSRKKTVYGSSDFVPSFWLEGDWAWSNLKQALSKTKEEMYTGAGTFSEFLAKTIQGIMDSNNLDSNIHVQNQKGNEKVLLKKKRALGLYEGPRKIRTDPQNNEQSDEPFLQPQQSVAGKSLNLQKQSDHQVRENNLPSCASQVGPNRSGYYPPKMNLSSTLPWPVPLTNPAVEQNNFSSNLTVERTISPPSRSIIMNLAMRWTCPYLPSRIITWNPGME